jgi:acyl carrier protein
MRGVCDANHDVIWVTIGCPPAPGRRTRKRDLPFHRRYACRHTRCCCADPPRGKFPQIGVFGQQGIYQSTQKFVEPLRYFTFALYHDLSNFNEKAKRSMSIRLRIISEMQRIAAEQQVKLPPLDDDLSLHETGFDSLGFAILVARLEDDLGIDPFTISEDASFPLTIGDFIRAYENVPA